MRVYCDLQAVQSPTDPDRGIARYVAEFSRAVEENHPGVIEGWLLNPELPTPAHALGLMPGGAIRSQDDPDLRPPDVWHVLSPFEYPSKGLDTVWPAWARTSRTRLAVTLYDLIPLIYADRYLSDPANRAAYMRRLRLVQRADRILAISEATANDAIRMLGIPAGRVDVVGTGVSEHFVPAEDTAAVTAQLKSDLPQVRPGYVLYTGGIDFRKNIEGLLNAYARLPQPLRTEHQLVIVCSVAPSERQHFEQRARALGIAEDFVLTGYVPDDVLLRAYQAAHLFVFPSLYEGFGLPVVEALSCGVPTIVGRNSSLTELVDDPNAWFDAAVADDITRALFRALTDDTFRASLTRPATHDYRWNVVAERSLGSYARAVEGRPRRSQQPRIAFVTPMPPAESGVADYSFELLKALAGRMSVDVFTNIDAHRPPMAGVRWFRYDELGTAIALHGGYDDTLYAMGNSEHHFDCLELLRRHGGSVIAHDVRYTGFFSVAEAERPALLDERTRTTLHDQQQQRLPDHLAAYTKIDRQKYFQVNDLLTGPVAESAQTLFVHSSTAVALARLNVPAEHRSKVQKLPFGATLRPELRSRERDTVVSFGIVDPTKRSDDVLDAFLLLAQQDPSLRFAMVGHCPNRTLWEDLRAKVLSAGLADTIALTGRVDDAGYVEWLGRARLAVQLRRNSNGETSAAVSDCLGAGVPTIVSRLGAMAELGDACVQLGQEAAVTDIAESIRRLLADQAQLTALGERGYAYAAAHSFPHVADALIARAQRRRRGDVPTLFRSSAAAR